MSSETCPIMSHISFCLLSSVGLNDDFMYFESLTKLCWYFGNKS